jgi:hypothetical protein
MWCIGALTEQYRRRMYGLLALYAKPLRADEPVICIDEKSLQLLAHSREPVPMAPSAPAKQDCECVRKGTTNLFVAVQAQGGSAHRLGHRSPRKDRLRGIRADSADRHLRKRTPRSPRAVQPA